MFMGKIKPWVPPGLLSVALYLLKPISGFSGQYKSWDHALADSKSYEDPNIVSMYRSNLEKDSEQLTITNFEISQREARLAMAILRVAAESGLSKEISVLDVGGATGGHRTLFSKLGVKVSNYEILETPAVVNALRGHSNHEMAWVLEPSLAHYDLVLCSGTLQYLEKAAGGGASHGVVQDVQLDNS
jgi:putative methyltransferase (TIGR04325 family)